MSIGDVGGIQGAQPIQPQRPPETDKASTETPAARTDSVEISQEARFLDQVAQTPDIREAKVEALRQQIEAGTYDTAERLDAAVERMLRELNG